MRNIKIGLWLSWGIAFIAGLAFTPTPRPDESALHYILASDDSVGSVVSAVVMSVCAIALFLIRMIEESRERERRDEAYYQHLLRNLEQK